MTDLLFFIEVVVAGLLAGTMYSLVALGFVLIYKASATFNFAQGAMVFFAVLSFVGFMELGLPLYPRLSGDNRPHGRRRLCNRTAGSQTLDEPERRYTPDGNHRPWLCAGRTGASRLGG